MDKPSKNQKPKLWIDWATHKAAKYACENWHYSKCLPAGKTVKFGVWEDGKFIGVVIYALGSNANISKLHGKTAELARVAMTTHKVKVTKVIAITLKKLKKLNPKLDAVISYADLDRHKGTIYTAGNWFYEGTIKYRWFHVNGVDIHPRSVFSKYGTRSIEWIKKNVDPKAKYVTNNGKKRFLWKFSDTSKGSVATGSPASRGRCNSDRVAPKKAVKDGS